MPDTLGKAFRLAVMFLGLAACFPLTAEIDEERAGELRHLLIQECGSCHGLTMRGGLGPALTPEALEDRHDIGLRAIILHGVPGTPMPGWNWKLSEEEAQWLVDLLREGVE